MHKIQNSIKRRILLSKEKCYLDEYLTTGQMIDQLQVGETAVSQDESVKTNVIRNSLGYYWTFATIGMTHNNAWRLLQIDSKVANMKWKIMKEND